ncbi:MAG: cation:proton antiporter [Gammaproteobacteria bacterium]|nr:cation:proton antiporter [Gammaproteobacteria bacterium]
MPVSETILILMILLAIGMLTAGLARKLPVPYTVLLVCVGIVIKETAHVWPTLEPLTTFKLTPDLVLFVLLPTLIFESGLNLNARQLINDIGPVMTLAVPALLISTFLMGLGLWYFLSMDIYVALVFGALISATDPVAVVALFKELGTPERLTILVEGESLLNDATAIVVFKILLSIALFAGMSSSNAAEPLLQFLEVFFGGVLVGIAMGVIMSLMLSRLTPGISITLVLSLVVAYTSFVIAEHALHLSGVMAVVGAAVSVGVLGLPSLNKEAREALSETWEFLALISNTLLFLLIGLSVSLSSLFAYMDEILITVALLLIVRASLIYTLVPMTTRFFNLPEVTLGEKHIMWWGGLKGGLAIAIVLSIPEDLPGRDELIILTLGVVLFTLLVNAPSIRPLIKFLSMDKLSDNEDMELKLGIQHSAKEVDNVLNELTQSDILSKQTYAEVDQSLQYLWTQQKNELTQEQTIRQIKLNALSIELKTLDKLYKNHIVSGYSYADLRSEMSRAREHIQKPERSVKYQGREKNPFIRLEYNLIKRFRESDWAIGLLSRYQNMRLTQHLGKYFAQVLMTNAGIEYVQQQEQINDEIKKQLISHYRERLGWFHENIDQIKSDFPAFYHRFEIYIASRSALVAIKSYLQESSEQGFISAKPYNLLNRNISDAFAKIKPVRLTQDQGEVIKLISSVPLFSGFSDSLLKHIAKEVQELRFLPGDEIIAEGAKGDALYIITHGQVTVSKNDDEGNHALATLESGAFFGEMALLEESLRTATVTAKSAVKVLRLRRKHVLELAKQNQEIEQELQKAKQQRLQ